MRCALWSPVGIYCSCLADNTLTKHTLSLLLSALAAVGNKFMCRVCRTVMLQILHAAPVRHAGTGLILLVRRSCLVQASIWHWAVARLLLVLWEHDQEIIRHAHDLSTDDEVRPCNPLLHLMSYLLRLLDKTRSHRRDWNGAIIDARMLLFVVQCRGSKVALTWYTRQLIALFALMDSVHRAHEVICDR